MLPVRSRTFLFLLAVSLATAGCLRGNLKDGFAGGGDGGAPASALAALRPLGDNATVNETVGYALFHPAPDGVWVHVAVTNLTEGMHAMHVHEGGGCAEPGEHLDLSGGDGDVPEGDLPPVSVNATGRGHLAVWHANLTVEDVEGRTLVIHRHVDGEDNPKVVCGAIASLAEDAEVPIAVANLAPTEAAEGNAAGVGSFIEFANATFIGVFADGLSPGNHGTHVHEFGSCEATEENGEAVPAGAAGGHFNPTNASHGAHAGDLPNLNVSDEGRGARAVVQENLTLEPDAEFSILNRSLVVHAQEDDLTTDPAGASGARVLCGAIAAV